MCPPPEKGEHALTEVLEAGARENPHHVILQQDGRQMTYGQLHDATARASTQLRAAGVGSGHRVVLLFQNTPECVVTFLALARAGAGLVPLEADTTASTLGPLLQEIGLTAVAGPVAEVRRVESAFGRRISAYFEVERLLAAPAGSEVIRPEHPVGDERPFLFHLTSGSTGKPKAALHTEANLINGARIYRRTFGMDSTDTILAAVPLLHSFGMVAGLCTSLLTGARLLLTGRSVPHLLHRTLIDQQATILLGVPLLYDLMTRAHVPQTSQPASRLRLCLCTAGAVPEAVAERFRGRYGVSINQVYGSTEAGIVAAQHPGEPVGPRGAVGRPVAGVKVRVTDDQGQAVPPGTTGNLLAKTPTMFGAYFRHPDASAAAFSHGWYVTGDAAQRSQDGQIHLVGRKGTFVNVGGKKVNPVEVQETLLAHPRVGEAVVWGEAIGNADEQRVQAAVVAVGSLSSAELFAFCRQRLLPYQVPTGIEFLPRLPKTALGKVRLSDLKASLEPSAVSRKEFDRP